MTIFGSEEAYLVIRWSRHGMCYPFDKKDIHRKVKLV